MLNGQPPKQSTDHKAGVVTGQLQLGEHWVKIKTLNARPPRSSGKDVKKNHVCGNASKKKRQLSRFEHFLILHFTKYWRIS
jgi:hypothetical protein